MISGAYLLNLYLKSTISRYAAGVLAGIKIGRSELIVKGIGSSPRPADQS